MKSKLLPGVIAALFAASPALAFEPFVVKDIRVEGIQRTEAGTVFSYLPVKVGERFSEDKASQAIKSLFATGFFKDVRIEVENDVIIVLVDERPAISQIDFVGIKEFEKDALKKGLKEVGLAESRIFDRALLERAEQELKRQYLSKGLYGVQITTTVTPLERNRVGVNFNVVEGEAAKIRQISIIGNKVFKEKELVDLFSLTTPGWMTWYSKSDQYSKQKLSADIEALRSFYLNRGYLDFSIDSTQVSITPDKKDIYITLSISEGEKYTVSDVKLAGNMVLPEADLQKLIAGAGLTDSCRALGCGEEGRIDRVLYRSSGESLNVKAALRHVLADLAGSVGVIIAAVVIMLTGWEAADPIISILISLLMASGVQGAGLIATDAIISALMGLSKVAIFGGFDRLDASLAVAGLLIGLCTMPGAFVARRLLDRIPARVHVRVMEAVVVAGGAGFLWRAWH